MNGTPKIIALDALLELYELAQGTNVVEFPAAAVRWLQRLVDFDMALLGVLSREPHGKVLTHFGHLVNESAPVLDEWVALIDKDEVVTRMLGHIGRATAYCVPEQFKGAPQILDFAVRSRHLNVLAAASPYGSRNLMTGLSLRRADAAWVFTPWEARTLEVLLPHVTQAFKINRSLFSKLGIGLKEFADPAGVCICDLYGYIIYKDAKFDELVEPQFKGENFHKLPKLVDEALRRDASARYVCGGVSFQSRQVEKLRVIAVRALDLFDGLTPREITVANFYGQGLTHKEIGVKLSIAPSTARRHVEAIYAKLGIRSKAELALSLRENSRKIVE